MVNNIIDSISIVLKNNFMDDNQESYKIYTKQIEQGFKEPCFFIKCLSPERSKTAIEMWNNENNFDIHYFPKEQNNYEECYSIGDSLMDMFELLTLHEKKEDGTYQEAGKILGSSMHYEIIDGVLHFFVNFNTTLKEVEEEQDLMESMTLEFKE